jgi:flagellar motility protein MotE (MotC chaperone)
MNVVGTLLISHREIEFYLRKIFSRLASIARASGWRLKRLWLRLLGKRHDAKVAAQASMVTALGLSATVSVWPDIPNGLEPEEAINRLRDRTDELRAMLSSEITRRLDEIRKLTGQLERLERKQDAELTKLHSRIDDIDLKPAGKRATGAILAICGTVLMLIASFIR